MFLYKGVKFVHVPFLSYLQIRQTEQKVKMTEEIIKIVKIMTTGVGVFVLKRGHKFKH